MRYTKINKELAKEFGKGNVELRPAPDTTKWSYILWFKNKPTDEEMAKAEEIVNTYEPTQWLRDEIRSYEEKE